MLIYLEELHKDKKKRKKVQPRLSFTIIDHNFGLSTPTTGGDVEEAAKKRDQAPPINSFERFFEQRWRNWGLGTSDTGKASGEYEFEEWEIERRRGRVRAPLTSIATRRAALW